MPISPATDTPRAVAISISPASASLPSIGDTVTFAATLTDQNGSGFNAAVDWSSGDADVITVNAGGGSRRWATAPRRFAPRTGN